MDPNSNGQQWQQQYFNPNEQYAQSLRQQSTGAPQCGYVPTAQQTPYEDPSSQHGVSQPSYQGLLQPMPTQQPFSNTQLQQQPSHQYYGQEVGNFIPAPSAPVGSWTQTQPNAQWQTATNNATTTTTTTTTTTKSTRETQASQPQHATSSTKLDFASLIQQAPQQQPVQPQQSVNYSQIMQSGNQQHTLLPPAPDFSQLMQSSPPQTQNKVYFSQLMQASPPPQPQVSQAPPVVQTPIAPQKAQSSNHASKSTNKSTTNTATTVVGSTSRQNAAEKGQRELRRFDRDISNRLKQYGGICPMGWDYYATRQGYLCGGTNHFVSHDDVEALLSRGQPPYIEFVNGPSHTRLVTPPPATGQMDGCGEPPTWEADPGWWERHKWRAGLDRTHPYGYPF